MRFMLPFMRTNGSDMYVGLAWPPRAVTAEAFQQIAPISVKAAHADTKRPARMAKHAVLTGMCTCGAIGSLCRTAGCTSMRNGVRILLRRVHSPP